MTLFKLRRRDSFSVSSGLPNASSFSFQLADCTEATNLAALYDEYKICGIRIDVIPRGNVFDLKGGDLTSGVIYEVVDYDDANALIDADAAVQFGTCRTQKLTSRFRRFFKPKILGMTYQSATTTAYAPKRGWVDMAYTGIPHYGWKFYTQIGGAPGTDFWYERVFTYYVACRLRR